MHQSSTLRDGRLVACTRDRLTRVWDQNGAQVRAFEAFPDLALRGVFSHDGGRVVAGDWSGTIRVWSAADGKLAGQLSPNPRPMDEQLEVALKELSAREAAFKPLAAAAAASQAAARKTAEELAPAKQNATDTAAAAKIVAEAVVRAKENADRANAPLAAAQAHAAAREIMAKSYAETAAKVQEAAKKAKDNKSLAAAAAGEPRYSRSRGRRACLRTKSRRRTIACGSGRQRAVGQRQAHRSLHHIGSFRRREASRAAPSGRKDHGSQSGRRQGSRRCCLNHSQCIAGDRRPLQGRARHREGKVSGTWRDRRPCRSAFPG